MLDFGFSEILLTSAIALVVLGPERLPKVARQVGHWMGRARSMARQLSEQLEREVSADELMKAQQKGLASAAGQSAPSSHSPHAYTPAANPAPAIPEVYTMLPATPAAAESSALTAQGPVPAETPASISGTRAASDMSPTPRVEASNTANE